MEQWQISKIDTDQRIQMSYRHATHHHGHELAATIVCDEREAHAMQATRLVIHTGTWRESCFDHGCFGCRPSGSTMARFEASAYRMDSVRGIQLRTYLVAVVTPKGWAELEVPSTLGPEAAGRRAVVTAYALRWGDVGEVEIESITELEPVER